MKKRHIVIIVCICAMIGSIIATFCENNYIDPNLQVGSGPLMKITGDGQLEYVGETPGTYLGNAQMLNEVIFGAAGKNIQIPGIDPALQSVSPAGKKSDTQVAPSKNNCEHEYASEITTPATCGEPGLMTYTCSKCGGIYTKEIPATGEHDYEETIIKEPTCTTPGLKEKKCKICGEITKEAIAPAGHKFGAPVATEPTCTEPGKNVATCETCGLAKETPIPAKGHTASDWVISKPAGMFSPGEQVKKCINCGEILETEEIPQEYPNWAMYVLIGILVLAVICIGYFSVKRKKS